jgi:hypothetical protein
MKIKELIIEDGSVGSIGAGSFANAPAGNLFAVPMKRNMPRKRAKKEAEEFKTKKDKSNVLENGTNNE